MNTELCNKRDTMKNKNVDFYEEKMPSINDPKYTSNKATINTYTDAFIEHLLRQCK